MEVAKEKDLVLGNLCRALTILESNKNIYKIIPEVRINFVYALEKARSPEHVAAIPGRITAIGNQLVFPDYPKFGASDHMARAIIEIMKYDPSKRAGINFKYTDDLRDFIEIFRKKEGLTMGMIDRTREPKEVSVVDGQSMPWKIKDLFESSNNKVPDIFFESSAPGKEPLFVLIGNSATDVANKLNKLVSSYYSK